MNCFPNENICPMFTIATKEEQGCVKELCAWWVGDKQKCAIIAIGEVKIKK